MFRGSPSRVNAPFRKRSDFFLRLGPFQTENVTAFSKSLAEFASCIMHVRKFASPLQSELRQDVPVRLCCVIKIFRNNSK